MFADFSVETPLHASCTCGRLQTDLLGRLLWFFFSPHTHTRAARFIFSLSSGIKHLSDARQDFKQSERSGQIQHHISFEQLPSVACGWAPSVSAPPAAPNYRQQWHHTDSGLLVEIMRGPIPGVRAPVRVSGFLSSNHLWRIGHSNSRALSQASALHSPNPQKGLIGNNSAFFSCFFLSCFAPREIFFVCLKGCFYSRLHGALCVSLKLDWTWRQHIPYLIYPPSLFQPGLGAKQRPRNYPEELDLNYVVCWEEAGVGCRRWRWWWRG